MLTNWSKLALFLSGLFCGRAIDDVIHAVTDSPFAAYRMKCGVTGDWALAALDTVIALILFWLHRFVETPRNP